MTTYEIIEEIKALEELLYEVNEETGEVIDNSELLKEYIDKIEADKIDKLNNIEKFKRHKQALTKQVDDEMKRLRQRKQVLQNEIERLEDLEMYLTQGEKIDTGIFRFSTRKSESVVIDNEDIIPDEFKKEVVEVKISKTELKKALKEGKEIEGAHIEQKVKVAVR